MTFVEKNEENLVSLVFALSNRDKTSIAVAIYDTDDTRDKAIAYLGQQVQSQHTLTFDLFGQTTPSLLAFFRDNLPKTATQERPIIHLLRLDPQLFTVVNHKVISSPLVAQINMEREMLFREVDAQVVLWLTREGYNRLRMDAPDFMDWVTAFVFECDDNIAVQPLSFQLPKETIEDRSNATLLQLREKAENLRHRTVKFEQRTKLSTKDAKEYFNLLLALIAVYLDLHALHQAHTYLQRAYNLTKEHDLSTGFETGKLLVEWGDTEYDLGNLAKAMSLFEEALQHFTLAEDKHNIGVVLARIGKTYTSLGDLPRALTFFEEHSRLAKELHEAYPQNVGFKNGLAISYEKLGDTHSALGDLQRALTFFEDETKLFEELHDAYPQNVDFKNGLAISYAKLGETHSALGDLPRALAFFEQFNQLQKELYEAYPQNVDFKNGLGVSYSKLGETHTALGNLSLALTFFEQSNRLEKELHDAYPQNAEFKSNYAESLAVLYAIQKLMHQAPDDSGIDTAIQHYEALRALSPAPNYQKKLMLCQQIKIADDDELKRLVTEISAL